MVSPVNIFHETGGGGGTPLPVADGGTGASTAAGIRSAINVADGSEANPALISQVESEGGTDANERVTSGLRQAQAIAALAAAGGAVDVQNFSGSGTWVKPASGSLVRVLCWGGGGAGAEEDTNNNGGGGGGCGVERWIPFADIGSNQTVTIGAAGAVNASAAGGDGGDTTFGAFVTAYGGQGGDANLGSGLGGQGAGLWGNGSSGGAIGSWAGSTTNLGAAYWGGGGGGDHGEVGGDSYMGGAGGGGSSGSNAGGASVGGGAGGAGVSSGTAGSGTAPGGGGGAAPQSGTAGAGALGRCEVYTYP